MFITSSLSCNAFEETSFSCLICLTASTKNAGAETVPASNDITKLEKSIIAMFGKEEEVRGKISKIRDAIVVFVDLIKAELGKNEQRSKFLVDAVSR